MKIVPLASTREESAIDQACTVLRNGGLVVYPTETCYGVGADATRNEAVHNLLTYKGNRLGKAISIAAADADMAGRYVALNDTAKHLYREFLPGPVTVVSESLGHVSPALESDRRTLGIRIPAYPFVRKLIAAYGKPITATSANTSGRKPPYSIHEWQRYTSTRRQMMVGLFLDAGRLPERQPSTVVDTTMNDTTILRQGELAIPATATTFVSSSVDETRHVGEEIMASYMHYLSDKPVIIALQGELGAGKTQVVKGLARQLGVAGTVNSPTYTLMKEYDFPGGTLYHIDTWRMETATDLSILGLETMLQPGNVIAIEWLQKVKPVLERLAQKVPVAWVEVGVTTETARRIRVFQR